jgi:hypothetical protein
MPVDMSPREDQSRGFTPCAPQRRPPSLAACSLRRVSGSRPVSRTPTRLLNEADPGEAGGDGRTRGSTPVPQAGAGLCSAASAPPPCVSVQPPAETGSSRCTAPRCERGFVPRSARVSAEGEAGELSRRLRPRWGRRVVAACWLGAPTRVQVERDREGRPRALGSWRRARSGVPAS